jgi:hypothetical protein
LNLEAIPGWFGKKSGLGRILHDSVLRYYTPNVQIVETGGCLAVGAVPSMLSFSHQHLLPLHIPIAGPHPRALKSCNPASRNPWYSPTTQNDSNIFGCAYLAQTVDLGLRPGRIQSISIAVQVASGTNGMMFHLFRRIFGDINNTWCKDSF